MMQYLIGKSVFNGCKMKVVDKSAEMRSKHRALVATITYVIENTVP